MNYDKKRIEKEIITPERAKELLKTSPKNQRNIAERIVRKYSNTISTGEWKDYFGEPFYISTEGKLVNGQHRCQAVITTNASIKVIVIYGCNKDDIHFIDQGKSRRIGDVLKISGYTNANALAAAVNCLYAYMIGHTSKRPVPLNPKQALQIVEIHSGLKISVKYGRSQNKLRKSIGSFLHYAYSKSYRQEINDAFEELKTGMPQNNINPIIVLRDLLSNAKEKRHRLKRQYVTAVSIKAINSYVQGRDIRGLRFSNKEMFPKIICEGDFVVKGLPGIVDGKNY